MNIQDRKEVLGMLKEAADQFRGIGLAIDEKPDRIKEYMHLDGVRWLAHMFIPEEFGAQPLVTSRGERLFFMSCAERVVTLEALSYGDAGVVLVSPGPSLSGHILGDLGTQAQKERFYGALVSRPVWTFFALTEPARGSDASQLETELRREPASPGHYRLVGEKYLVGNGVRGSIGVVFARTAKGPLGIEIALVEANRPGFSATTLPTLGLRGAGISHLRFSDYEVSDADIVGKPELPATRRGLWGAIKTFNRMRPGVAAIALGVAQATYDYIVSNRRELKARETLELERFAYRLHSVRTTVRQAAAQADADPANGALASVAKIRAVELVEAITEASLRYFGPTTLFEHPYLNKWYRDARGFEYMEGTTLIQKQRLFESSTRGKLANV